MPLPCALDNCLDRLKLWAPPELVFGFFQRRNKPGRIARSAWLLNRVDLAASDFAASRDYLLNTGAASSAKIVEAAGCGTERQNVSMRKIDDMNVVANTCSVACLIISAINFEIRSLPDSDLEHVGNQVCLRAMIFAEVLCSPCRVEVTQ